jgi:hypothetical protein
VDVDVVVEDVAVIVVEGFWEDVVVVVVEYE